MTRDSNDGGLGRLHDEAAGCRDCPLYRDATQTVFGEGRVPTRMMLLGEQPGDHEDRVGRPFVGPAGTLLDALLDEAGIDRADVYVTNAVKHFKWVRGHGKARIHKSPSRSEVAACSQWWQRELEVVDPSLLVCLGAVAARAVLGPSVRVTQVRGQVFDQLGISVMSTLHPAALLRGNDRREELRAELLEDLVRAKQLVAD